MRQEKPAELFGLADLAARINAEHQAAESAYSGALTNEMACGDLGQAQTQAHDDTIRRFNDSSTAARKAPLRLTVRAGCQCRKLQVGGTPRRLQSAVSRRRKRVDNARSPRGAGAFSTRRRHLASSTTENGRKIPCTRLLLDALICQRNCRACVPRRAAGRTGMRAVRLQCASNVGKGQ